MMRFLAWIKRCWFLLRGNGTERPLKGESEFIMQKPPHLIMKFLEKDDSGIPTGRSATFSGVEFLPLAYDDLVGKKPTDKVVVRLEWRGAKIIESNIPDVSVDHISAGNMILESIFTSKAIGLVKDGWLPSGLAVKSDTTILPDRCTIADLQARFIGGSKKIEGDNDFLDLLLGPGIRINPLLFALEGNIRKNPTPAIVEAEIIKANAIVAAALPDAEIVPQGADGLRGVIGIVQDTQQGMENKAELLMRLASRLHTPTSSAKRGALWEEILETADACKVPRGSLVVLALMSSISVPKGRSPAKKVLKLTDRYSAEDAYNALSDLRALELFIGLMAIFPNEQLVLFTGDKNLALFWVGICASDFSFSDNRKEFRLSPVDALLPSIDFSKYRDSIAAR